MTVTIALDSFKGCMDSLAAGRATADGVRRVWPAADCRVRPLADGGEGTVNALVTGLGGNFFAETVTGPDGHPVTARYGILPGDIAVMEMASAAGLPLLTPEARDPLRTTTFGVGELIRAAYARGARNFVIGIGGSATNDGGAGMLQALGFRLTDAVGQELPHGGAALARLAHITPPAPLAGVTFRIACDVANPLCGAEGASAVFGPQKGATPEAVAVLDAALANFAAVAAEATGNDFAAYPGAGAAGGLGFAFKTFLNGDLVPGVDLVLDATHLADAVANADLVITGEGRLDGQTVMGKAPIGVARLAKRFGRPVLAFSGCIGDGAEAVNAAGIDAFFPILRQVVPLERALEGDYAAANLADTVEQACRALKLGGFGA